MPQCSISRSDDATRVGLTGFPNTPGNLFKFGGGKGTAMKKTVFKMTMGLGIMVLAAQHLQAQTRNCAPRADVVRQLAQDYGETRRGVGLARQGAIMEVFASEDTGSWTITITLPDGVTCLVASGQYYEPESEAMPPNV